MTFPTANAPACNALTSPERLAALNGEESPPLQFGIAPAKPVVHTILVVDDNAPALKATTRILQQVGYHVAQAADGATALREVRALRPSLVLLDVVLPDISGREVLRQIRADPSLTGVSVVLLSALQTTPPDAPRWA